MKPKVAILLSTYNGEKYLESQVQTILNQAEVDISLFVRQERLLLISIVSMNKFNTQLELM